MTTESMHEDDATVEITVTYLEMRGAPKRLRERPAPEGTTVSLVDPCPIHFYRYLYNTVGGPWHWWERRTQPDELIVSELSDPCVYVFVPYVHGAPAGLAEVDARKFPDIELRYFGVFPEHIGQGLGGYLLDWVVDRVWESNPERFWLHTCTLDSPRAVPAYEASGFTPCETRNKRIRDPRRMVFTA